MASKKELQHDNVDFLDLSPSPSSLIESLRDIGYSMQTAVADIIDNSITARAKNIHLRFAWNSGSPWLAIIDDGHGMNRDELIRAMRFGSISPLQQRAKDDLGRFGLGMKTASFSQCRLLTVLSKQKDKITCCEWDLDLISRSNESRWLLHVLPNKELKKNKILSELYDEYISGNSSGTIVIWREIDRIDDGISKSQQESYLNGLISDSQQHLELVFHRFLSPDPGHKKLNIYLNNNSLEAFDPFNSRHDTTVELREETFPCGKDKISTQPFVLPHHNKISKDEYQKYAGKEGYLQNQGFYVYRNRRLIIKGTWFRLMKKAELTKLVRVRVDIPNSLDHLWKIDVKKSNASPPESIRNELKRVISRIECSGKKVYEQRGKKLASSIKTPAWERRAAEGKIYYEINRKHPLVRQLHDTISSDHGIMLNNLFRMFEGSFPTDLFFSDIASSPEQLHRPGFEDEQLSRILDDYIDFWGMDDDTTAEQISELMAVDPFSSNKKRTMKLLEQKGISHE